MKRKCIILSLAVILLNVPCFADTYDKHNDNTVKITREVVEYKDMDELMSYLAHINNTMEQLVVEKAKVEAQVAGAIAAGVKTDDEINPVPVATPVDDGDNIDPGIIN